MTIEQKIAALNRRKKHAEANLDFWQNELAQFGDTNARECCQVANENLAKINREHAIANAPRPAWLDSVSKTRPRRPVEFENAELGDEG